jgi:hypothetical protein
MEELPFHLEEARILEDEWISSDVRYELMSQTSPHSDSDPLIEEEDHSHEDLVVGLLLGFLLGLIVVPFLRQKKFHSKYQMALLAGLFMNLLLSTIYLPY